MTRVYEATVNGKPVFLFWDNASAMDFAEVHGVKSLKDIGKEMSGVFERLKKSRKKSNGKNEKGEIEVDIQISDIALIVSMVHAAIISGAEAKGVPVEVSKRDIKNAVYNEKESGELLKGLVEVIKQFMPTVDDSKKKPKG